MALPLSQAFTARAIRVVWDNYKASLGKQPYLGRMKFGTRKQIGLDISFITGRNGLPVTLKTSNFDARAELRNAIGFKKIENSMPFFREGYMVSEKEEQDYASFVSNTDDRYAMQVLNRIMKNPLDLIDGANVVPERMIWQLLAPTDGVPKINLKLDGQAYTIDYTGDNGVEYKRDHFTELTGTSKWSDSANATPLDDLITVKRTFAKKTGNKLGIFSMNTETWEMVLAAEDTKKQVLGTIAYQGGVRLDESDVVVYLKGKGITIEVYDKLYVAEDGTTQYFIPTGVVSCQTPGVFLGDVVYGTTPEERSGNEAEGNLSIVDTGVAVYTYTTQHPVNTFAICSEIVLPTYEGMDSVHVMKVA